jgi:hypothetical protein
MKTDMHFWPYVAQFCLDWEIFWREVVEKNQIKHIILHIRTVRLDIIKVLFTHQLMHWWVVFKKKHCYSLQT